MITKFKRFTLAGFCLLCLLCLGISASAAEFFTGPTRLGSFLTNASVTITNETTRTFNGAGISLPANNDGIAISPVMVTTNSAAVDAITFTFEVSIDGTNYCTLTPFTYSPKLNGTTTVIGYTNWGKPLLANAKYIRLKSIATAAGTNTLTVSALEYSFATP